MNKTPSFINICFFILTTLMLLSCSEDDTQRLGMMPNSHGGLDEVLVVADRAVFERDYIEAVEGLFKRDFIGLPQKESLFDMRFVNYREFPDILKRMRNIVFIATQAEQTSMSEFIRNNIPNEQWSVISGDTSFLYFYKENIWASPQLVIFVYPKNKEALAQLLPTHRGDHLVRRIQQHEMPRFRAQAFFKDKQPDLMRDIRQKSGIHIDIPGEMQLAKNEGAFFWMRRDTDQSSMHLFTYSQPISMDTVPSPEGLGIQLRNKLGVHVETPTPGAFMITEYNLLHHTETIRKSNTELIETRGLWRMEGDFLGGPFVNQVWLNDDKTMVYMVDGFVYAPGITKRRLIRKLDAVFSTIDYEKF